MYRTCSSRAFSNFSGAVEGRPAFEYISSKDGESAFSAPSTIGRIRRNGWSAVGNNIPVFFIQDAIKFPDLIHPAKQEPDRDFPQAQTAHDNFWDFISLMPESIHMVMWIMSDRTIPRSFRFMEGFGVHTFRLVNAEGKSTFVKFHWKPRLGLQTENFAFDVLDATKLIPEEEVPIRKVGRLVLDRCVDNFFAETEQVAFCTSNICARGRFQQ